MTRENLGLQDILREKDSMIAKYKAEASETLELIQTQEQQIEQMDKTHDLMRQRIAAVNAQMA